MEGNKKKLIEAVIQFLQKEDYTRYIYYVNRVFGMFFDEKRCLDDVMKKMGPNFEISETELKQVEDIVRGIPCYIDPETDLIYFDEFLNDIRTQEDKVTNKD